MIQIRNVPDELHQALKARAASAGMTLSDYLLEELGSVATRPTMREWVDEVRGFDPVELSMSPAEAIAAERERRP